MSVTKKKIAAGVASSAAVLGLVLAGPLAANASDQPGNDNNNVTITPTASSYTNNQTVTVSQSGLAANTAYTVGQCEWQTYFAPPFGAYIPACAGANQISVTTDGSGAFSTSFTLVNGGANVHASIPGQPATVDFSSKVAEIVVTPGHGSGGSGSYAGDSAEFTVN